MARPAPHLAVLVALVLAVAVAGCGSAAVRQAARPHRALAPLVTPDPSADPAPSVDLAAARAGVARARAWWDPHRGWYDQYLPATGRTQRATVWGIVHLFGAYDALAIADPSPADVAAARRFGIGAERYWNPDLKPVPGYSPTPPGGPGRSWYDDEGWWGVAQFDAFRATHDRRFLADAARSLRFVDSGWDPVAGGIWWNDRRTFKASEGLAGGTLIAAGLFEVTHRPRYLALARKYIGWADRTIRAPDGLYGARSSPRRPMPYVEGPMAEAFLRLCHATGRHAYCRKGEHLLRVTVARFPTLTMPPQCDAIYLRSLLEAYGMDHNPRWYRIAASVGAEAMAHAARPNGLFLRTWGGRPMSTVGTPANKLQTHAATTSVLAWLAAAKLP
jgi:hypothetical protein